MKDYPNEEALRKAHRIYLDAMRPFVIRCLKKIPGRTLEDLIRDVSDYEPSGDIVTVIDINNIPLLLRNHWYDIFSKEFNSDLNVQNTTWLIVEGRNFWAHPGTDDVDSESTRTHLFHVARVLGEIKNSDAKEAVETIRDRLFSDEVEEHPVEVENAALKEKLSDKSDKFAAVEAEKHKLEKRLQDAQKRLEELKEIEAAWMDSEERVASVSDELKTAKDEQRTSEKNRKAIESELEETKAEKTKLTEDLNTTSTWLEDVEKEKAELEQRLKKAETEKTKLKENLKSRFDQLKKLEKVQKENAEVKKDLETAKEEQAELEKQLKTMLDSNIPNSVTFQDTTFTKDLDKYRVAGDDIAQTFWRYWHTQRREGKQEMRDAGWSVEKVDGNWEISISTADYQAWIENEGSTTQPTSSFHERTELPTGKEMEQPALELLSDGQEYPRIEIINLLTEHFSLTENQRKKLSRSGKAEVYLRNKGLIERTRTGYYCITTRGLQVLRRSLDNVPF